MWYSTRFFGMAKNKNVILNKHTFNRSVRWLARILGYCFSIWANVCLCSLPVQSNLDGRLQSLLRVASSSSAASGHPPCLRYCNKISFYENWCHYLISTNKWTHKQTVGWTDGQTKFLQNNVWMSKGPYKWWESTKQIFLICGNSKTKCLLSKSHKNWS